MRYSITSNCKKIISELAKICFPLGKFGLLTANSVSTYNAEFLILGETLNINFD